MKKLIFLTFVLSISAVNAQIKPDSVYVIIRSLIVNTTQVTRSAKLDSAAALHARYLIDHHKTGHLEEDRPQFKSPMKRAEYFGDNGQGIYEVCWAGPSQDKNSVRESIFFFKNSSAHWYIMTDAMNRFSQVRFGYARIQTNSWNTCVIIYSVGAE